MRGSTKVPAKSNPEDPELWAATIESILSDMGLDYADKEAVNLISLVMQRKQVVC